MKSQLWGEIIQLVGLVAIGCGLIIGVGHWRFELPTLGGVASYVFGYWVRHRLV
jgi:hypothetical protein